jgi:hypothetical protein
MQMTTHGNISPRLEGLSIEEVEKAIQLDLRAKLRASQDLVKVLEDIIALDYNVKTYELLVETKNEIDNILSAINPIMLGYTEHNDGEQDDLTQITSQSWVDDQGNIDGPTYSYGVSIWAQKLATNSYSNDYDQLDETCGFWTMSEQHIRDRETRLENANRLLPEDNSDLDIPYDVMSLNQAMLTDDKHISGNLDFGHMSMIDRRKSPYNLAVYKRNGIYHENIRILMNGTMPLCVSKDFEPQQVLDSFEKKIKTPTGKFRTTRVREYKTIKVGNKEVKVRVKKVICHLMRFLHINFENLTPLVQARFRICATNLDRINTNLHNEPIMKNVYKRDDQGRILLDEDENPIPITETIKYVAAGGLDFKKSWQLAPKRGFSYTADGSYCVMGPNAVTIKNKFLYMMHMDQVKTCVHIEKKNDKRVKKQQIYAVIPFRVAKRGHCDLHDYLREKGKAKYPCHKALAQVGIVFYVVFSDLQNTFARS